MQEIYHQKIPFPEQQSISLKRIDREITDQWRVNHHFHDLCEMVIYENINGEMFSEGQHQQIRQGQVLFIPPDNIHSFVVQPGRQIYHVLHFQAAEITRINPDFFLPNGALLSDTESEDFEYLLSLLRWNESLNSDNQFPTIRAGTLELIISLYFEKIARADLVSSDCNRNTFGPLVKYLTTHNKYQLSVEQAAEVCHLSRSHFMSKFKKAYGVTFNQFMVQRKIDAAKHLLRSTNLTITEIAHRMEMDNASYFTKVFKAEVGSTPKAYAGRGK